MGTSGDDACSDGGCEALSSNVGRIGAEKREWMVGGGGCSLKTSIGSGRICDKMVAVGSKQGGRRRGGPRRTNVGTRGERGGSKGRRQWTRRRGTR